jgi:hypothetical protein
MNGVDELLACTEASLCAVKQRAVRWVKLVVNDGVEALRAGVPIAIAGCTALGGMSRFMHRIISGTSGQQTRTCFLPLTPGSD